MKSLEITSLVVVSFLLFQPLMLCLTVDASQEPEEMKINRLEENKLEPSENEDFEIFAEEEEEEEGGKENAQILPEWWGLGEDAQEAAYVGLAELGVALILIGMVGYSTGKRLNLVPSQFLLPFLRFHESLTLLGVLCTTPHFLFVGEWEGLGFLTGILLFIEVVSGLYGRYLHKHVVQLGRGEEQPFLLGRLFHLTKKVVLKRWRHIHIWLTFITVLVLGSHILTVIQ